MDQTDKKIKNFFEEQKWIIADNGFSRQVIEKLPVRKKSHEWLVFVFALIGIIIVFLSSKKDNSIHHITDFISSHITEIMLLPLCIPFLILLFILKIEKSS